MLLPSNRTRAPRATSSNGDWLQGLGLPGSVESAPLDRAVVDRSNLIRLAMIALITMVLLGPLMTITENGTAGEGSAVRQIGYLLILGLTVYAIWPVVTRQSGLAVPWPILAALGWCWLSVSWAIDPGVSARRLLLTTLVAWMVFAQVRHGGYRLATDTMRYTLLGTVLICYLVVLLDPMVGTHLQLEGDMPTELIGNWRGFLGHKNFAGAVSALCILMFVFDAKRLTTVVRLFAIVVAAYFLFRSQSKTSAGMLFLALLGGWVFEFCTIRLRRYLLPILILSGTLIWLLQSAYADLFRSALLNPKAFTGRGQIWASLLNYARDNPVFGAGFGSFWNIPANSPIFQYGSGFVTKITLGHSGYLDQLVAVGLPGLILMVFATAIWPIAKMLVSPKIAEGQGALISAMLIFCIGHNTTETGLFERDVIVSTLFFFACALAQYCTLGEQGLRAAKRADGDALMRHMKRRTRPAGPTGVPGLRRSAE